MQLTARQQEVLQRIQVDPTLTLQEIATDIGVTRERVRQISAKLTEMGAIENRRVLKEAAAEVEQAQKIERIETRRYRKRIWHRMAYVGKRLRLRHAAGLDRFGMSRDYHMPGIEVECQFSGCDRSVEARGFCALHYGRLRYTGSLWINRRSRRTCKENDCRLPVYARNMCHNHYSIYIRKHPVGTGIRSHNTSGYRGVSWSKQERRWFAYVHIPRKGQMALGSFDSKEMAARAHDTAVRKYIGNEAKLNFPNENIEVIKEKRAPRLGISGYRGIEWHGTKKRWLVRITREGRQLYVGSFTDLEEAAHVQDSAAKHYLGDAAKLNFPDDPVLPFEKVQVAIQKAKIPAEKRRPNGSSQYRGVTKKRDRWAARIEVEKTPMRLGGFATEEEAARAYDAAARKYFGDSAILNFPDDNYQCPQ